MHTEEMPILYYIQDTRSYTGNSVMWWAFEGAGYTSDLDKAWRVSKEEADRIVRNRPGVDKAWPCHEIDARATRHFDMQRFREIEKS